MADNYLERRMEDYRSGSRNTPRRAPRLPKKSVLKILIVAEPDEALHSIIAPLAAAGHRVALAAPRSPLSSATAQKGGARLFPDDFPLDALFAQYEGYTDVPIMYRHPSPAATVEAWLEARSSLTDCPKHGRIILIDSPVESLEETARQAAPMAATVNAMTAEGKPTAAVADTLRWLMSPLADHISGHSFVPDLVY